MNAMTMVYRYLQNWLPYKFSQNSFCPEWVMSVNWHAAVILWPINRRGILFLTGLTSLIPNLAISHVGDVHGPGNKVKFTLPPPEKCAIDLLSGQAQSTGQVFHVIVEVKDDGYPCLCSYKRVVIQVTNRQLRGGRDRAVETVTEWLQFQ
jgi:hypothetical protein